MGCRPQRRPPHLSARRRDGSWHWRAHSEAECCRSFDPPSERWPVFGLSYLSMFIIEYDQFCQELPLHPIVAGQYALLERGWLERRESVEQIAVGNHVIGIPGVQRALRHCPF